MDTGFNIDSIKRHEAKQSAEQMVLQLERSFESALRRYGDRQLAMRYTIEEAERKGLSVEQMDSGVCLSFGDEWAVKIAGDEFGKLSFTADNV